MTPGLLRFDIQWFDDPTPRYRCPFCDAVVEHDCTPQIVTEDQRGTVGMVCADCFKQAPEAVQQRLVDAYEMRLVAAKVMCAEAGSVDEEDIARFRALREQVGLTLPEHVTEQRFTHVMLQAQLDMLKQRYHADKDAPG